MCKCYWEHSLFVWAQKRPESVSLSSHFGLVCHFVAVTFTCTVHQCALFQETQCMGTFLSTITVNMSSKKGCVHINNTKNKVKLHAVALEWHPQIIAIHFLKKTWVVFPYAKANVTLTTTLKGLLQSHIVRALVMLASLRTQPLMILHGARLRFHSITSHIWTCFSTLHRTRDRVATWWKLIL